MVMWTCKTKAPWLCQLKSPECCWHVTNVLWPDRVLLIVCIEVRKQERTRRVQTSAKPAKFIQNTIRPGNLDSFLMPMTHVHVPEKPAWRDHCPIRYQKLIPEKFGTKLHVRRVRNRGTGFSVTAFWRRFLVSVSWALLAIRISQLEAGPLPVRLQRRQHHNGQQLSTTASEGRTPFTTVDNTGGETAVVHGLQQLWFDTKSNRRP